MLQGQVHVWSAIPLIGWIRDTIILTDGCRATDHSQPYHQDCQMSALGALAAIVVAAAWLLPSEAKAEAVAEAPSHRASPAE